MSFSLVCTVNKEYQCVTFYLIHMSILTDKKCSTQLFCLGLFWFVF